MRTDNCQIRINKAKDVIELKKNKIAAVVAVLTLVMASGTGSFALADSVSVDTASSVNTEQSLGKTSRVEVSDEQHTLINEARTESMKKAVANLVEKGTMTQEEADSVLSTMENEDEKIKAETSDDSITAKKEKGNFADLTDEQSEALKSEKKTLYEEALTGLVTNGTITQEQADNLNENGRGLKNKSELTEEQMTAVREAMIGSTEKAAQNLVASRTLTQEEADSIILKTDLKYAAKSDEDKTQIKSKGYLANLTDEQAQALKDEFSTIFKEALADLVTDGSITQEIADHVQNMPKGMGHVGRGRK
jgi:polyhydroxyalkanoate synthesis regulator phasin